MTDPIEALDAIEQALADCKKLLVAIKNSNDLDGRIAFLPQKTEETIQNAFDAFTHLEMLKQQVAELVAAFREAHEWRPIETAPKGYDGNSFNHVLFKGCSKAGSFAGNVYISGWMDEKRKPIYYYQYKLIITHWRPITNPDAYPLMHKLMGGQGA